MTRKIVPKVKAAPNTKKAAKTRKVAKAKKAPPKKFRPLHNNVLIEKDKVESEEQKTPGGLFLPPTSRKPPNTALVIAVGPEAAGVKAGDTIVVGKFSGTDVVVNDEEFVVISLDDVLGLYQ